MLCLISVNKASNRISVCGTQSAQVSGLSVCMYLFVGCMTRCVGICRCVSGEGGGIRT